MIQYTNIRIYTSEKARHEGKPLADTVLQYIHNLKIASRCAVFRVRLFPYKRENFVPALKILTCTSPDFPIYSASIAIFTVTMT
jgi:PII-like signaling protein